MNELTCKDCKYFIGNSIDEKSAKCVLTGQHYVHDICNRFETTDGKRPRFCRLASSVDEMADHMIFEWVNPNGDKRYYIHNCPFTFYDWHKAQEYAKNWLMEVE